MINKTLKFLLKFFIALFFLLAIGFAYFLSWNSHHNRELLSLKQIKSLVMPIALSPIEEINNYKVVYVNGQVTTHEKLRDKAINLNLQAIGIFRKVFMYQWEEQVEDNQFNKDEPRYHYQKIWSENLIDSSQFHFPNGHNNPAKKPLNSKITYAKQVNVGDFVLSNSLIKKIKASEKVALTYANKKSLEQKLKRHLSLTNKDAMICTGHIETPNVGDICIEVNAIFPQTISIIAQQNNKKLRPYLSPTGHKVAMVNFGSNKPDVMIEAAVDEYQWHSPFAPIKKLMRKATGF